MNNAEKRIELANTLTHLAGVLLFCALIPFLISKGLEDAHRPNLWALLVFSFGLLTVYSSSTLYHFAQNPGIKRALRIWDHISIYFLIGGTYTPLVVKYLDPGYAQWFLLVLWGLIAVGVAFKLFFTGKYDIISTLSYLGLGWMALFIIQPFIDNAPSNVLLMIVLGGLCYTVGVIFYVWKRFKYHHAVWHVFVLGGSIHHFLAVKFAYI